VFGASEAVPTFDSEKFYTVGFPWFIHAHLCKMRILKVKGNFVYFLDPSIVGRIELFLTGYQLFSSSSDIIDGINSYLFKVVTNLGHHY
jgi:hypothetical protein